MTDKAIEVISWDPADHTDLPGFAHGLTRYGDHWMDIGISAIPVDTDPLEALDQVFARLRETVEQQVPDPQYFTVELRVTSRTPVRRADEPRSTQEPARREGITS